MFAKLIFMMTISLNRVPCKYRHIISLSTPIILGMLSINIIDIVDTMMIAHLGNKAWPGLVLPVFYIGDALR